MPIMLDAVLSTPSAAAAKLHTPKFFDAKLIGAGKKIGLINENRNPIHIPMGTLEDPNVFHNRKYSYANGKANVTVIPLSILPFNVQERLEKIPMPDISKLTPVGQLSMSYSARQYSAYIHMDVDSIYLEETVDKVNGNSKVLKAGYRLVIYALSGGCTYDCQVWSASTSSYNWQNAADALLSNLQRRPNGQNYAAVCFTTTPLDRLNEFIAMAGKSPMHGFDGNAAVDYITNYSLYDGICEQAAAWNTTCDQTLDWYFGICANPRSVTSMNNLASTLRRMEDYSVPLDLYRNIYADLKRQCLPDDVTTLCKQNLNLLLSDTLCSLEANKPLLTSVPAPANYTPAINYSQEQLDAITSKEPLTLVQSGAGTGKSTVILGRINYMLQAGIKPEDITVLSFTNAAANHISDLCPKVHSMTIARMIHTIYMANFTKHELSSIETIVNALDIYFTNDPVVDKFKYKLIDVVKNAGNAFTLLNNFVEKNYDKVIDILDTIRQTSLELEIIICYQKIDTFTEPPEVQSKYLIIDEVQDNSLFEFVYTIKYVDKHKESLYIVGDCSQTLYEFRASNPKALNMLEGSGVFKTYQLQVNYRSNQEILDFANVALRNIEANQYAHIQLQANSLNKVTAQTFQDKVQFVYKQVDKLQDFTENLGPIFATDVRPYMNDCMARGEKIALLAFTRRVITRIQEVLAKMYPNKNIVSLVPEKGYNSTIFSEFIKRFWDEVKFAPTSSIVQVISRAIIDKLDMLVYNKNRMLTNTQRLLANWESEQKPAIDNWQRLYTSGAMTLDAFLGNVKNAMLQYEIRNNSIRQALLSAKNEEQKKAENMANADIILSTIHSAKGLEFPNVVVIYRNENTMPEDKKRMYYVALTRAMNSELVLAYDTTVKPRIQTDYEEIVDTLSGRANGPVIAIDDDSETEDNAANADIFRAKAHLKKAGLAAVGRLGDLDKEKPDEKPDGDEPSETD